MHMYLCEFKQIALVLLLLCTNNSEIKVKNKKNNIGHLFIKRGILVST